MQDEKFDNFKFVIKYDPQKSHVVFMDKTGDNDFTEEENGNMVLSMGFVDNQFSDPSSAMYNRKVAVFGEPVIEYELICTNEEDAALVENLEITAS